MYSSRKSGSIIDVKNKQKDLKIGQIIKSKLSALSENKKTHFNQS